MKKSIYEIEHKSKDISDYVFIHKDDYERLLKFDKKNIKAFDIMQQEEIKNKSKLGASQRMIAKEYKTSVATINKILRDKY